MPSYRLDTASNRDALSVPAMPAPDSPMGSSDIGTRSRLAIAMGGGTVPVPPGLPTPPTPITLPAPAGAGAALRFWGLVAIADPPVFSSPSAQQSAPPPPPKKKYVPQELASNPQE